MMALGIAFGTLQRGGDIEPVKYVGGAKVIGMVLRGLAGLRFRLAGK
jgi:hypothetical protein